MLIILDGPDGSGKTTLAKEICRQTGGHYQHMTYRWPTRMVQYHTAAAMHCLEKALKSGKPAVIDRWWMSEVIYAKVFRDGSQFPHYGRMLDRLLRRFGGVYVICLPGDVSKYKAHFQGLVDSRDEMYDDSEKMLEIRHEYEKLVYGSSNVSGYDGYMRQVMLDGLCYNDNALVYDLYVDGQNIGAYAKQVITRTRLLHEIQGSPEFDEATIGTINSNTVFVGDVDNLKWGKHRPRWPFFENANSSLHLCKIFDELNVNEDDVFIVNINHEHGVRDLAKYFSNASYKKAVIVMGENAEITFLENFEAVKYTAVPHPQSARRFPKRHKLFLKKLRGALSC